MPPCAHRRSLTASEPPQEYRDYRDRTSILIPMPPSWYHAMSPTVKGRLHTPCVRIAPPPPPQRVFSLYAHVGRHAQLLTFLLAPCLSSLVLTSGVLFAAVFFFEWSVYADGLDTSLHSFDPMTAPAGGGGALAAAGPPPASP